ncbi:MAG: hypothetical protein CVU65_16770 [Deltaproteobacteria bacterium HGW-Deltaproteobacteria-22]|jgi:hypothetical protein|nr:MAG: hypothetical protein CVU65_16770 [Deltaproteobacteria bacterium HGW-Deltaproteobacteria-22]
MDKKTSPSLFDIEHPNVQETPTIRPCPPCSDMSHYPRALDEYICRRSDRKLNLSLLVTPHHKHMRIVDYRLGQYKLKCNIFDEMAAREKLKKVYTLVEKQDSNSWRTVGFSKEAIIPGYFRNADAYVMSRVYDHDGRPITGGIAKLVHEKQIEFAEPEPIGKKPAGLKEIFIDDPEAINAILHLPEVTPLYHPFGKGVMHPHFILEVRIGRRNLWVAAEINDAFGHAKLDILTLPRSIKERRYLAWMVTKLVEELGETSDISSVFSITMVEDISCGQVLVDAGFKDSGQLTRHMQSEEGRLSDALMWFFRIAPKANKARKMAFDPELPMIPVPIKKPLTDFDFDDDEEEVQEHHDEDEDED